MSRIGSVEILQVDLAPKVVRTDAIQAFVTQETPIVRIRCDDGTEGVGYSYTIGTGGSSVVALLRDHLAPKLIGRDPDCIEAIWKDLFFHTHATAVGAITSLALAAIDTALWDLRCKRAGLPLWKAAGGARAAVPVYTTEGGWLQLPVDALVAQTHRGQGAGLSRREAQGRQAARVRGRRPASRPCARRWATRSRSWSTRTSASTCPRRSAARARSSRSASPGSRSRCRPRISGGHVELAAHTAIPIAVGESLYHPAHFREYLARRACSIVQVDCARIGGITPWLKVAHLAEAFNVAVCPHFLMELHVSLTAAAPNAAWVEYIPQLDDITTSRLAIADGHAVAPSTPGLGIDWDFAAIDARAVARARVPH